MPLARQIDLICVPRAIIIESMLIAQIGGYRVPRCGRLVAVSDTADI
jgi:hypothetical protein